MAESIQNYDDCVGIECCPDNPFPATPANPVSAAPTVYWNTEQTVRCASGSTGNPVTVPAHTVPSEYNQNDADTKAFLAALAQLVCVTNG